MKKTVSLFLIFLLVFPVFSIAEKASPAGTWIVSKVTSIGISLNVDSVLNGLLELTVTLNEDGSASASFLKGGSEGNWVQKGDTVTLNFGGSILNLTYNGENLSIKTRKPVSVKVQLVRKEEAGPGSISRNNVLNSIVSANGPSDFDGTWTPVLFSLGDELFNDMEQFASAAGYSPESVFFTFDNGIFPGGGEAGKDLRMTFADGVLFHETDFAGFHVTFTAQLLDDGRLLVTAGMPRISFICERTDDASSVPAA